MIFSFFSILGLFILSSTSAALGAGINGKYMNRGCYNSHLNQKTEYIQVPELNSVYDRVWDIKPFDWSQIPPVMITIAQSEQTISLEWLQGTETIKYELKPFSYTNLSHASITVFQRDEEFMIDISKHNKKKGERMWGTIQLRPVPRGVDLIISYQQRIGLTNDGGYQHCDLQKL